MVAVNACEVAAESKIYWIVLVVLTQYIGLWKRESIQLADAAPKENETVFWLQAEQYFADIRIPFDQPRLPPDMSLFDLAAAELPEFANFNAFAGTIDATESWIRWNRTIDFKPNPSRIDQGSVHFEDRNLIEIGEFEFENKVQQYREIWVPQSHAVSDRLVLELAQELNATTQTVTHPKALWVTVGAHFIRIYDARMYPPDFVASSDLSGAALKQLMHFQVDYGTRYGDTPWQILLSNDPSRVGTTLRARPNYQARWLDDKFIESWCSSAGETLEHHWHVRELTADQTADRELNRLTFLAQRP